MPDEGKVPAALDHHAKGHSQQSPPQAYLKSIPDQPLPTIFALREPQQPRLRPKQGSCTVHAL